MTQVQSKGKKIAIVAVARKLAELMYALLKNGTSYEKRTSPTISQLVDDALAVASWKILNQELHAIDK